ncbi:Protein phosphatase 2C 1 [Aspergillus tanneri]|uniref:Protein phosphatase 2C 1 n=1 Tax=Aspergillus tanneri TaxID=1220188 RepID=A0A5M9MWB0_9EURO|nr:Protein phosphatase 2C 1 [Aspergillus tanneri]KAA8646737.1 Protein phosphatase 2C 1 [Aspergillus tanneri]
MTPAQRAAQIVKARDKEMWSLWLSQSNKSEAQASKAHSPGAPQPFQPLGPLLGDTHHLQFYRQLLVSLLPENTWHKLTQHIATKFSDKITLDNTLLEKINGQAELSSNDYITALKSALLQLPFQDLKLSVCNNRNAFGGTEYRVIEKILDAWMLGTGNRQPQPGWFSGSRQCKDAGGTNTEKSCSYSIDAVAAVQHTKLSPASTLRPKKPTGGIEKRRRGRPSGSGALWRKGPGKIEPEDKNRVHGTYAELLRQSVSSEDISPSREKKFSPSGAGFFSRRLNEDQGPTGEKKRRRSTLTKAASFFINAKNSLTLNGTQETPSISTSLRSRKKPTTGEDGPGPECLSRVIQ